MYLIYRKICLQVITDIIQGQHNKGLLLLGIDCRRIAHFVRLQCEKPKVKLHDRHLIITFHSVIYKQLSALRYKPMLQNSQQKAGCDINSVMSFDIISVAFDTGLLQCRSDVDCENVALVRCAYCSLPLCSDHFTYIPHLHFDEL